MPRFPEQIARTMLSRFGIDPAGDLQPWPFPEQSSDLLARFRSGEKHYLLKRRIIEQRGERSLFETQFIQKELLKKGIPVPELWEAPNGETLLSGPDWEEDRKIYFEIQEEVPGGAFVLNEGTAHQAGQFLGRFHQAGAQIDTFLLNKGYWIKDFTSRRYAGVNRLREHLHQHQSLSERETRIIGETIERAYSFSRISSRTWGLYHGDMCANNLLSTGEQCFLVDLDEMGIGEVWGDIFSLMSEVPEFNPAIIRSLVKGYRDGGGTLNEDDLLAITDTLVLGRFGKAINDSDTTFNASEWFENLQFIMDL